MRRTTENLDSKCGLNAARAFFQKSDVLLFGLANTSQRGAEANADAILWFFAGILNPRVFERELCRYDRELSVAVEPLQTVRREELFRIPIANLAGATHPEHAWIKTCDAVNAALFRQNAVPKRIDSGPDASNRANTGDDRSSSIHAVTLFALAST